MQLKGSTLHFSYSTRASVVTHEQLVQSLASTSRVLLVHVVNLMYPVSIEMLHTVRGLGRLQKRKTIRFPVYPWVQSEVSLQIFAVFSLSSGFGVWVREEDSDRGPHELLKTLSQ